MSIHKYLQNREFLTITSIIKRINALNLTTTTWPCKLDHLMLRRHAIVIPIH